jgi:hypothetical protein
MRLSLRFIVPLLIVLAMFAYAVLPLVDGLTVRWFMRDLDIRASLIANTVQEPIYSSIRYGDHARVVQALTPHRSRPARCRRTSGARISAPIPGSPATYSPVRRVRC